MGYALSVVSSELPSGEGLPLLVDRETWVPVSLALRWTVLRRRYEVAESTLRRDLNGLRYVYAWGDGRFREGLEARIETTGLGYDDLVSLRDFCERPDAAGVGRAAETNADHGKPDTSAGARALAAKAFLTWAVSPASRNQRGSEPRDAMERVTQIEAVLGPLANRAGEGKGAGPLDDEVALRCDRLLAPLADADGRYLRPLRWRADNPFRADGRLRNWLMWCIARDLGLRLGEMLCLQVGDFATIRANRCLAVVRRPDALEDTRKRRPAVKTLERTLPLSADVEFGLRAYMTERPPVGRRRSGVYLFTSRMGHPLSANPADRITKILSRAVGARVHWHGLRHAWATDIARGQLRTELRGKSSLGDAEAMKALLTEHLRLLGGWSEQSTMPMYYARVAIKEYADDSLRLRQDERVQRMRARAMTND